MSIIVAFVIGAVCGLVGGVLIGRKNKKKVEMVVDTAKKVVK